MTLSVWNKYFTYFTCYFFLNSSVNHLDIAPQHASVLMGLSNTFATLPGILSPLISGYIVTEKVSISLNYFFRLVILSKMKP